MSLKEWRQIRRRKKLLKMIRGMTFRDLLAAHYESHTGIGSKTFFELILCKRVRGNIYQNFNSVYNRMLKFSEKDIRDNFEHDQRYSSFEKYE